MSRDLGSAGRRKWALMCASVLLALQACTDRSVVEVFVASITLSPVSVTLVVGEEVDLVATVVDETEQELNAVPLTWTSSAPSIAEVDGDGLVRGRSEGTARIEADFGGATGAATVRVVPGPGIELSQSQAEMFAGAGGTPPPSQIVHVTNIGTGALTGLHVDVEYPSEEVHWLEAEISGTSVPTTVVLSADTEGLDVGVRTATVMISSSMPDVPAVELPVTLELTGFSVLESGGSTVVAEAGTTDTLSVVLDSEPDTDVILTVMGGDAGEAVASPSTLTFTRDDWSVAQAVTVRGIDDFTDDGDQVTRLTIAVVAEASDDHFDGIPPHAVDVTTTDDDEAPGLVITETEDTEVGEDGSTDSFTVALTTRPGTDVLLTVTSGDPGEAAVTPSTLTFTTNNWDVPQTVTVAGVDDFADDGPQVTALTISVVAVASDDAFDGIPARTVQVTTLDDDEPAGLIITETGTTEVDESGTTDTFTVVLTTRPGTDVVLTVTSGDPGEVVVSQTTITFTTNNWDVPRSVTVTGVNDLVADGDQTTGVTVAVVAEASDNAFDGVPAQTVNVVTRDDDLD
ncbi:MAG: Ig-like domain-containing protein [Gemmatimonadetes bacterium]|nr:Ig-like domain-containing protein [Gemmatimonadota bacterium]